MKIRHIGIVTINLNSSLNFWTKHFKFKVFKSLDEKGKTIDKMLGYNKCKIKSVKLKTNAGIILELIKLKHPKLKKRKNLTINNGITHFALTVKNLENFYKRKKDKINFNCTPQLSDDGKVKVLYAKTPENCYLELVEDL